MKVQGLLAEDGPVGRVVVSDFVVWCQERDVMKPRDVTKPMLERYQRMLFYTEKPDGSPLTLSTQHHRLSFIKQYFKWLARENHLLSNPASELELPKVEKRLPEARPDGVRGRGDPGPARHPKAARACGTGRFSRPSTRRGSGARSCRA